MEGPGGDFFENIEIAFSGGEFFEKIRIFFSELTFLPVVPLGPCWGKEETKEEQEKHFCFLESATLSLILETVLEWILTIVFVLRFWMRSKRG